MSIATLENHRKPAEPGSLLRVCWHDEIWVNYEDDGGWRPKGIRAQTNQDFIVDWPIGSGATIPFGTKGLLVVAYEMFTVRNNDEQLWYQVLYKENLYWVFSGETVVEKRVNT